MMQYVILETLTGVSEIILVFHEVKKRCYLREAANIHPEMHNILVFLSTLFSLLFTSKTYRTSIEDISNRACVNCFIHPHMVCLLHRLTRTCNIKHQSCKSIYHYCNNEIENSRNSTAFCYLHFGIIPFLTIIYDSAFVCMRISLRWYRCSGELVPRGAEAWYRSYRSDGTGTKRPLHTLSEGAMQTVLQGTLN